MPDDYDYVEDDAQPVLPHTDHYPLRHAESIYFTTNLIEEVNSYGRAYARLLEDAAEYLNDELGVTLLALSVEHNDSTSIGLTMTVE